jgi:predicted O-methyltransferase YrrM
MSISGTRSYAGATGLPPLVAESVALAESLGFGHSCRVEQGRLLAALASGAGTVIGESGTGCGVGLAWLATGRRPGVRIVSVELDHERAQAAAALFADVPDVDVVEGDWTLLDDHAPFDLLVLDGPGNAKHGAAADPDRLLAPGGSLVVDDFTPMASWPPLHGGEPDTGRLHWLEHPSLLATEVRLAPDLSAVLATRRP